MASINPFAGDIVADAWQPTIADIPEINHRVYEKVLGAIEEVRSRWETRSFLVHGVAGTGKTHLLGRIAKAVTREGSAVPAIFVSVRLDATPDRLLQLVRRQLAEDLTRALAPQRRSQLEGLLLNRLANLEMPAGAQLWRAALDGGRLSSEGEHQIDSLFEQLWNEVDADWNLQAAIMALAKGRERRAVKEWLATGILPDSYLARLGFRAPVHEDPEEEAFEVIRGFAKFIGTVMPVVLSFDQIEGLERKRGDHLGIDAFGRMIDRLHAHTKNFLLLSSVQTVFLDTLKGVLRRPMMDRLSNHQEDLELLDWDQASALIRARLDSDPVLARERQDSGAPFHPLDVEVVRQAFATKPELRAPRGLLHFCMELFDGKPVDGKPVEPVDGPIGIQAFLATDLEARMEQARSTLHQRTSEEILASALPMVAEMTGWAHPVDEARPRYLDLVLQGPTGAQVGISYCDGAGNALTGRLRHLAQLAASQPRVVAIRDPRRTIPATARVAREVWEALPHKVRPSIEVLTDLEAIRSMVLDAKAGDLSHAGRAVAPKEVQTWLFDNISTRVIDFLDQLLHDDSGAKPSDLADSALRDEVLELLHREHLLLLGAAASALKRAEGDLMACSRGLAEQVGVLEGPPVVLFERVLVGVDPGRG